MRGLVKAFDRKVAVDRLSLDIPVSSFYGIVGPNGAGKTTSLSMATGLLRPDAGQVLVHGVDVWARPQRAKTLLGVLPDGLRTFDRLNGLELVTYSQTIQAILRDYAAAGGTVVISSHVMATVQRLCDHVAIINAGRVVAAGTTEQVAAGADLEQRFTELVGGQVRTEGLSWLRPSSS